MVWILIVVCYNAKLKKIKIKVTLLIFFWPQFISLTQVPLNTMALLLVTFQGLLKWSSDWKSVRSDVFQFMFLFICFVVFFSLVRIQNYHRGNTNSWAFSSFHSPALEQNIVRMETASEASLDSRVLSFI